MRAGWTTNWLRGWLAVLCGWAAIAGTAFAQPVFDVANIDTEKSTPVWIWVDCYVVDAPDGLDYYSFQSVSGAQHGGAAYDPEWGLITYVPDDGYEGFDGFTYTMADAYGNRSDPIWVFIYVEPDGSITNLPPVIVGFWVEYVDQTHRGFNGVVLDDQDPYGRTVQFGDDLSGYTTTIGYDGQFSLYVQLPYPSGTASVKYQDPWGVFTQKVSTCFSLLY